MSEIRTALAEVIRDLIDENDLFDVNADRYREGASCGPRNRMSINQGNPLRLKDFG
ncbi:MULTISPECIES: hypothetical protein [unclassified Ruegeria]|uniref:hypothetical protein n=1 Tax=unclassified Ruegeria TaxID=2625375 RepID=UPI001AE4B5B3|nr:MULTISPECIES: hypothetical protein [unclassified Ruegeria]